MSSEITTAKALERADLVFLVRDGTGGAIITPRGRRLLTEEARKPPKASKPPVQPPGISGPRCCPGARGYTSAIQA